MSEYPFRGFKINARPVTRGEQKQYGMGRISVEFILSTEVTISDIIIHYYVI